MMHYIEKMKVVKLMNQELKVRLQGKVDSTERHFTFNHWWFFKFETGYVLGYKLRGKSRVISMRRASKSYYFLELLNDPFLLVKRKGCDEAEGSFCNCPRSLQSLEHLSPVQLFLAFTLHPWIIMFLQYTKYNILILQTYSDW